MSMRSQDYAELADHAYDRERNMRELVGQEIALEGVKYSVLDFVDNPRTGYQGTIYQRVDSGDIIVAHRGTEFEREKLKDLIVTDGAMVLGRTNPQADDAIALTARAQKLATDFVREDGRIPEVTVTGHSLGATLAQITAHYYDLRGETFNAYGAVSLNYRIPEGGDRVINHVTAGDMVSAASPHYGQVRMYAMPQEVEMLRNHGYANNDSRWFDPRNKLGAAIDGIGSHDMHFFRNVDGDGQPDRSVLTDPRTVELAREYAPMIDKYRQDVEEIRSGLAVTLRGQVGLLQDGFNRLRGTLEPGEPAAREEQARPRPESSHDQPQLGGQSVNYIGGGSSSATASAALPRAEANPISRLLEAARSGDPAALQDSMRALQDSAFGQAWQQRVASQHRALDAAELAAPEVRAAEQRQAQEAGLGR